MQPISQAELQEIFSHPAFEDFARRRLGFCAEEKNRQCAPASKNFSATRRICPQQPPVQLLYKKRRVHWTPILQYRFLCALEQLGIENAKPTEILCSMNVVGLTRANISSHLQKFRLNLHKGSSKEVESDSYQTIVLLETHDLNKFML
jgi:SHAQKYF class myb-like DNA-binding protein